MITIVGISGSLREKSFNRGLLNAAAEVAPNGCTVIMESIKGIPLYDGDIEENDGIPQIVTELKDRVASADGLLLVTPEYNNSIPGVFKNTIDWLSRPPKDRPRVYGNKPVGLIGATPGNFGTAFSQYAWLPTLRVLGTQVWSGQLLWINGATSKFDKDGKLIDDRTRNKLADYISGFADFVTRLQS